MTKETNPEAFNAKAQELRLCISYVNLIVKEFPFLGFRNIL